MKKLTLPLELMPPPNTIINIDSHINRGVQELSLTGINNDVTNFNLMITLFPNIKVLRLNYMIDFPCESLSSLNSLEKLVVGHFKIESLANVKLPKLQRLEIENLYPLVYTDWENITKINPQIEEIVIHEISHHNTMTAIKNCAALIVRDLKSLRYLKIIQNQTPDCLKIIADMRQKTLKMSPFAMKMCKEIFVDSSSTTDRRFDTIKYIF